MKLSRHAITVLTRQYKSVLLKCALINAGLFLAVAPAMATNFSVAPGTFKVGTEDVTGAGSVTVTGLAISDTTDLQDALDARLQASDITEGTTNGTISVDGTDVAVKGLGTAAYADAANLQTKITDTNMLDADLVDDTTSTHKFVTAAEKTQITTNATNITTLQTDVSSLESLVGTDPTTGTGILAGKTIGTGTDNLNVIDALNTVAGSAAAKDIENIFSQKNTFGTTTGQQVVITNDGRMSVDQNLTVGSSDQFQVSDAGAVTTTSTLSADGESKFGKIGDTTNYALDVVSGTDAASSTVTANAVIEATQGVRFGAASETNPVMTSVNHDSAIAAMNTADNTTTTGNNVVASAQAVAKTRDAINAEVNEVLGGIYKINNERTVDYDATALDTAAGDTTKAMFKTGGTTAGGNLTESLANLANNINAITGGTISATDGTVNNNYAAATSISYNILAETGAEQIALAQAIGQVDKNIGAAITGIDRSASLTTATTAATSTVNANINALDAAIGNLTYTGGTINYTNATGSVTDAIKTINANIGAALTGVEDRATAFKLDPANSVNENLAKLDAAIGKEVSATYNNITTATSVNANLDSLDAAIGDRSFATTHYVAPHDDLSTAVTKLDKELHSVNHKVRELRHDMNRGLASVAALSALVPNARGTGNTSLSVGTGHYHGQTAMALGGAHWFTDNLMVNIGVASTIGHTRDATYRAGVSYSF